MEIELGIICVLLLSLTFLSTVDMAFGQLSDVGLRRLIAESERQTTAVAFLTEIIEDRPRFRFTLSAVIQILLVAASVLLTSILLQAVPGIEHTGFVLLALASSIVVAAIFRQVIPRLISVRNPERTLLTLLPLFRPFHRALSFVAMPFGRASLSNDRVRRSNSSSGGGGSGERTLPETEETETEETDADDLQALIEVGEEEGILEEEERELIHSIIEFGDTRVNEVMTPRTDIVGLPVTATVREARDVILESKYSRLPVYREQIDNIEGLIYVRDLLLCWASGSEDGSINSLLRPTYFVPETKSVADLLKDMQQSRVQLAMVVDEYGGIKGLVTVEDILEEIVGEIEDEDTEEEEIVEIVEGADGYYDVLGSTEIGKIERLFDLDIEEDDFTTVAGLVISESGTVPSTGASFKLRGLDVEVLDADDRKINRVRLRRAPENVDAEQ